MDRDGFRSDIEAIPGSLAVLAGMQHSGLLADPSVVAALRGRSVVLTGMGSSWFAADTCARRMRRAGLCVVAELASAEATLPAAPEVAVVGISASGRSSETLSMLASHVGTSATVLLTNDSSRHQGDPALAPAPEVLADLVAHLHAGTEAGGVACRSYVHTLAVLLAWEQALVGTLPRLGEQLLEAAEAVATLLDTASTWLPEVSGVLDGPDGTWLLAPAERLSSALQGALMLREGPRRPADGCETGDWSHVDVYLTKTLDYRALVFAGSRFDTAAETWMRERASRFVAVGPSTLDTLLASADYTLRHPHDHDPVVRLLAETVVADLVAADWWSRSAE